MKKRKKKKGPKVILVILLILVLMAIMAGIGIYQYAFDRRFTSPAAATFDVSSFPGLQADRYEFQSVNDNTLVGYHYHYADQSSKAVMVMAHGIGQGGQKLMMDCANYFAANGFSVFAYDVTGNDESGGSGVRGLPQGVADLDYAISFVENCGLFQGLPVVLFGYSWGGYSVGSVLNYHSEVRAVASLSGFNSSADLIGYHGKELVGGVLKTILMPFVRLWETVKFGRYAINTSLDGFANTDARIMVIHSSDDSVVPVQFGYDKYHEKYGDSDRFEFVLYNDRNHFIYHNNGALDNDLLWQIADFYRRSI